MAQKRPVTPEKQLLGLIEGSHSRQGAASGAKALGRGGLSFLSPGAWLGRLSFLRDRFRRKAAAGKGIRLDVVAVNRLLAAALFALIVYFVANLAMSITGLKKFPPAVPTAAEELKLSVFPELAPLKAADYLGKIRQRDIFKIVEKEVAEQRVVQRATTDAAKEATAHLRLVGISWSKDPDVMIEDTRAMRTFFVKQGQMVGDVLIQKITKDKVVLSYGGQEIDLK